MEAARPFGRAAKLPLGSFAVGDPPDGAGEIVFGGGPALGWTVPTPTAESLTRPVALDVLIRPVVRLPALRSLNPQRRTYEDPFDTRFRFKR